MILFICVTKKIQLCNTNKENHSYDVKEIKLLNKPMVLVNAEHDCKASENLSTESARKSSTKL